MQTRVYQKENNLSLFKHLKESFADIWGSRFLARQLAERDIKAQYRQSLPGDHLGFYNPTRYRLGVDIFKYVWDHSSDRYRHTLSRFCLLWNLIMVYY